MNTMIHRVIDLNNRGVQFLEAGDHELARISFKEALERTTYLLNLKQEAEDRLGRDAFLEQFSIAQDPYCCDENGNCSIQSSPEMRNINQPRIQRVPISTTLTSRDTGSFIYSHALMLSRACCTSPASDEYCHRESAVIMFNLALVHHWRGMHFGVTSLLPKALKLYEMSYSLIQNGATFSHHLVLALLNNMGQIHHELTQYEAAEHCFKNLKDLLGGSQIYADGDDVQGFLMNIMFLEAPGMAPAA